MAFKGYSPVEPLWINHFHTVVTQPLLETLETGRPLGTRISPVGPFVDQGFNDHQFNQTHEETKLRTQKHVEKV